MSRRFHGLSRQASFQAVRMLATMVAQRIPPMLKAVDYPHHSLLRGHDCWICFHLAACSLAQNSYRHISVRGIFMILDRFAPSIFSKRGGHVKGITH